MERNAIDALFDVERCELRIIARRLPPDTDLVALRLFKLLAFLHPTGARNLRRITPRSHGGDFRTIRTGRGLHAIRLWATEPRTALARPVRPCEPIPPRGAPNRSASCLIPSATSLSSMTATSVWMARA